MIIHKSIKIIFAVFIILIGCGIFLDANDECDCEIIVSQKDHTNFYQWKEISVDKWSGDCKNGIINESTYLSQDSIGYEKTEIICKF